MCLTDTGRSASGPCALVRVGVGHAVGPGAAAAAAIQTLRRVLARCRGGGELCPRLLRESPGSHLGQLPVPATQLPAQPVTQRQVPGGVAGGRQQLNFQVGPALLMKIPP